MTYGSLFSGVGGLDLALEAFDHTAIWQAESDPYARAVLARHWPGVHCYEDVRQIDHEAPTVDIICGGSPCQDISNAGRRAPRLTWLRSKLSSFCGGPVPLMFFGFTNLGHPKHPLMLSWETELRA
jgi:site-specific DNA-cytosine methylase